MAIASHEEGRARGDARARSAASAWPARLRRSLPLLALVLLAGAIRGALALREDVIDRDGIRYVTQARAIQAGAWESALAPPDHPGYAALIAGVAALLGADPAPPPVEVGPRELSVRDAAADALHIRAARLTSALLGALTLVPVFALGRQLGGRRAGLWAAALLAVHPFHALYSHAALIEATFACAVLVALALAAPVVAPRGAPSVAGAGVPVRCAGPDSVLACAAGAACGVAYLVRPEGLAVGIAALPLLLAAPGAWAGRGLAALAYTGGLAAVAWPYAREIAGRAATASLTAKRSAGALVAGALDGPLAYAGRLAGNLGELVAVGHPAAIVLAALGLWLALRRSGAAHRASAARVALLLVASASVHLAAGSLVRVERRFALIDAVALLPLAGLGSVAIATWVAVRLRARARTLARPPAPGAPSSRRLRRLGVLVAACLLGAVTLPVLAHKTRPRRDRIRLAAERVRSVAAARSAPEPLAAVAERSSVFCRDPRVAYYAGFEAVTPRDAEPTADALERVLRARALPALVVLLERDAPEPLAEVARRHGLALEPLDDPSERGPARLYGLRPLGAGGPGTSSGVLRTAR